MTVEKKASDTVAALKDIPLQQDLKNLLEQNVIKVDFLKLNGDRRVMTCTLREDIKPPATRADTVSQKSVQDTSDAVICVWDVNAQGWRSFRYDRVSAVYTVEEYQPEWYRKKD